MTRANLWRWIAGVAPAILLPTLAVAEPAPLDAAFESVDDVRRIEFATDEGTWLSVDLSPDEDSIYFDLLGDIYRIPATGGDAAIVLGGVAFESQPAISPDGGLIAFVSDRSGSENLWLATVSGDPLRRLSRDSDKTEFASPAWAPDGRSVFVSRRTEKLGVFEIWQFDVTGQGRGIRVAPAAENSSQERADRINALGAAPSPDGRFLYYATKTGESWDHDHPDRPVWKVERLDLLTGDTISVVANGRSAMRPRILADGRRMVYAARRDAETGLRLRDLRTGADRWLVIPVERDNQDGGYSRDTMPGYDVTDDGRTLIASAGGKLWRMNLADGERSRIPFTARVSLEIGPSLVRTLPPDSGPVRARIVQTPAMSPDGERLAFAALGKIYVMDFPNGRPVRATRAETFESQPAWSPDGRWLAYVSGSAAGSHLARVDVGRPGSATVLTAAAAHYTEPVIGPDGRHVYALHSSHFDRMLRIEEIGPTREATLIRVPARGGAVETLAHAGTNARRLQTARDTDRLVFTTSDGVVSMAADGSDRRTLFQVEGPYPWHHRHEEPVPVDEVALSPDGNWMLTRAGHQLYLLSRPPAAADTPAIDLDAPPAAFRRQVSDIGADYFEWADDGKTIVWSIGSTVFRRSFDGEGNLGARESTDVVVELERDVHSASAVLRGATALTQKADETIEDADIVVTGNRIVAIGRRNAVTVPPSAEIIDVSGSYIVPGFVDAHAHWYELRRDVIVPRQWSFLMSLAYGITAGLDVQGMDQDSFVYSDLVDAGIAVGPRAYTVGKGMFSDNRINDYDDAARLLRRYRDYYRTRNVKSYMIGNRYQRRLIVAAANALEMLPTTEGFNDLKLDITHAVDGFAGNEHYFATFPVYRDVVELFARSRIAYTPLTILSSGGPAAGDRFLIADDWHDRPKVQRFMPHVVIDDLTSTRQFRRHDEQVYAIAARDARRIMQAGGRVAIGSHGQFQGVSFHWEMQAFAAGGWTPTEILRAATLVGADVIGRKNELGSLETGKLADLLILTADPRTDIRNAMAIKFVMKNGRLYDGDTLDEIWPRQRSLPALWHHDESVYP